MKISPPSGFIPALALVLTATARAGTPAETPVDMPPPPPPWEFRASMYGWLTGLDGTTGVGGLTSQLDVSFLDIVGDLKMAAALQFEARKGNWGIIADGFYVELGASGSTRGPIFDNIGIEMEQFIGELSLAYRVYASPPAFVDLYTGMRYNKLSLDFVGNRDPAGLEQSEEPLAAAIDEHLVNRVATLASAEKDWLDPVVGVRVQWNIDERFFLAGKSDIGGFGGGSDLAWSVQATAGYNFTPHVSAELGYRYLHTDYSDGSFDYDVAQAGLFTSLNFKF